MPIEQYLDRIAMSHVALDSLLYGSITAPVVVCMLAYIVYRLTRKY